MQRPQLALLRVQSNPEDVNFGVNHARCRLNAGGGTVWPQQTSSTAVMHCLTFVGVAAGWHNSQQDTLLLQMKLACFAI